MSKKPWICAACRSRVSTRSMPGDGQQVGDQLGRDRRARLRAAVLPGVAEVGHHRGDPVRRRPAQRVGHDHQLHQVVVRRVRRRLDDEHVLAADVLEDLDEDLGVVEALDPGLDQLDGLAAVHRDAPRDRGRERTVGVARDQLRLEQGVHCGPFRGAARVRSSVITGAGPCKVPRFGDASTRPRIGDQAMPECAGTSARGRAAALFAGGCRVRDGDGGRRAGVQLVVEGGCGQGTETASFSPYGRRMERIWKWYG